MTIQWMYWLLFAGFVCGSSGNSCDSDTAAECYADLLHYESLAFPLYGQDELKLDETCLNINESFECLESYTESCFGNAACDEECIDLIRDAEVFNRSTGLRSLTYELCREDSHMRAYYLNNYDCLEKNADAYAACHNDSQRSQEYLNSLTEEDAIPARCCFFRWYDDCFSNVTRDKCNEEARFFVSFAMHQLVGHIFHQLCPYPNISCPRPPLPLDIDYNDELDKDKPQFTDNEIDNSIDGISKASGTISSFAAGLMVLSYSVLIITKRFL